jgi:DNA-binding transcriptional MerR regulator
VGGDQTYSINELAANAGMTARNVRAYRTRGLLPPPLQREGALVYDRSHLERLLDVQQLREAGVPLRMITEAAERGADLSQGGELWRLMVSEDSPWSRSPAGARESSVDLRDGYDADLPPVGEPEVGELLDPARTTVEPADDADRPWFAGYRADHGGTDVLGRGREVDVLCTVLAARSLETPLAVGLFGGWGSGKSFFIRMMQERLTSLSEASAASRAAGRSSFYCSRVVQVTFNAWLHADSAMWPSLAAKVFRGVSGAGDVIAGPRTESELASYREVIAGFRRERERERREGEAVAKAVDERIAGIDELLARRRAEVVEQEAAVGVPAAARSAAGEVMSALTDARGLPAAWRELRPWERVCVAGAVAAAVLAIVLPQVWPDQSDDVVAWLAPVVAAVALAWAPVRRILRFVTATARTREEIRSLTDRRAALVAERTRAEGQIDAASAPAGETPLLPRYVREQAGRWAEQERRGDLTEIRQAFERLSALISAGPETDDEPDELPIDRVVVYIDDLDRCPADKVVSVLGAINLLLDLPHFVVVVGVDSRWLFRSLELALPSMAQGHTTPAGAQPQEYLEKIFQYSLVLPPVDKQGFARLVDSMFLKSVAPWSGAVDGVPVAPDGGASPGGQAAKGGDAPTASLAGTERSPEPMSDVDLTPRDLVVTDAEIACIRSLSEHITTPRAVKRLTNVYRLLRVYVGEDVILAGDAYRTILPLLAIAITDSARFAREAASHPDWAPTVAAFSFHPWLAEETAPPDQG